MKSFRFLTLLVIALILAISAADCHPAGQNSSPVGHKEASSHSDPEETISNYDHGRGSHVSGRDRTTDYRCLNGAAIEKCPPHLRLVVDPSFSENN